MATKITLSDQEGINKFSSNHLELGILEREYFELGETHKGLVDAALEMELSMEPKVLYRRAGLFVLDKPERVLVLIEEERRVVESKMEETKGRIRALKERLGDLRKKLYETFGNKINLEV